MLYNKNKKNTVKRSYEYLHKNSAVAKAKKRRKPGRITLSGRPKIQVFK